MRNFVAVALALTSFLTVSVALAQTGGSSTPPQILPVGYPIAELGGCASKDDCREYCDINANHDACFAYAQTHGLMTHTQVALAQKLLSTVGPGGCVGEACKTYCNDSAHGQVCIAFAQQNGFISKDDAGKRLQGMKFSSTTRPVPPIHTDGTGTIASSTRRESGQSGSAFLGVLHFFGL